MPGAGRAPDAGGAPDGAAPAALAAVLGALRRAEAEAGRPAGSVTLVAASKTVPAEGIAPLLAAGHRDFGENRVQEALAKWPALRERFPGARLHLIGPLQSNKAREAVEGFDAIHALDRPRLAEALAREAGRAGRLPRLFVQVNTGEEPRKAGVLPAEADAFITACRATYGLSVEGLTCVPPEDQPPSPHFALLRAIAERHGLPLLSMGMSGDYERAVALGATHVRVGSALFGARAPAGDQERAGASDPRSDAREG